MILLPLTMVVWGWSSKISAWMIRGWSISWWSRTAGSKWFSNKCLPSNSLASPSMPKICQKYHQIEHIRNLKTHTNKIQQNVLCHRGINSRVHKKIHEFGKKLHLITHKFGNQEHSTNGRKPWNKWNSRNSRKGKPWNRNSPETTDFFRLSWLSHQVL